MCELSHMRAYYITITISFFSIINEIKRQQAATERVSLPMRLLS